MDEGRRISYSAAARLLSSSSSSSDPSAEVWHSTPVKQKIGDAPLHLGQTSVRTSFNMDNTAKPWVRSPTPPPADPPCPSTSRDSEDLSSSTIQKQRRELQLLMAALKDRDKELNSMAASHRKLLHAWEQDRHRAFAMEQRCSRSDAELQKRNEVISVLTKRVLLVETREKQLQQQLSHLQQQQCQVCQDYEDKKKSLNSTVAALSAQVGSLQVRKEELSSMLKLKDKDVSEASSQIAELTGRLREREMRLMDSRSQESDLMRDLVENKRCYRDAKQEVTQLREELQQQVTQSSTQREEIIRLKQELQLLRRDLAASGTEDSWKDELLELAQSKQERTMSELRCLQQVCENQRSDLERAREALRQRSDQSLPASQEELICNCADNRSASSIRGKTSSLPAAGLQGSVNLDLGVLAAHLNDGDGLLSSCSLQRLLDESRQDVAGSEQLPRTPKTSQLCPHQRLCSQLCDL